MKKKVLLLASLAICAAIVASGTLAYFTTEETAHNVITTGSVGIELVEKTKDDSGTEIDFPAEGISGVMPGTSVSKIVSVKNDGEAVAWIRIWVNTAISDEEKQVCLPLEIEVGGETIPVITLDTDGEKWTYEEGYYYYNEPVAPGASTGTLFETVKFAPEMGNEYQNCKVLIDVAAEAVQTANNPIPDGGDVTDVKGWPET